MTMREPTRISLLRAAQGEAALLPLGMAADLLGVDGARAWILEHVRIRWVNGKRRVKWGDVLAATEEAATPKDEGRALRGPLPRRSR